MSRSGWDFSVPNEQVQELQQEVIRVASLITEKNRRIEQLEQTLNEYGRHLCSCALNREMGLLDGLLECDCGLDAARGTK